MHLAASSVIVAVSALRFFYTVTLKRRWVVEDEIPTGRQAKKLPVVLSKDEVAHFLGAVDNLKHRVILTVCYATGLRFPRPSASPPPQSTASAWLFGSSRAKAAKTVT
jgi:site-specific recombinase XerD